MPVMSDRIRTSKSTLSLVVVTIHILWISVFLLTFSHPLSWEYIHASASLLWLFEIASVMTLSVLFGSIYQTDDECFRYLDRPISSILLGLILEFAHQSLSHYGIFATHNQRKIP
jgi:hypothetical protein